MVGGGGGLGVLVALVCMAAFDLMWYIVRLDSCRVATRHSSHTPQFDEGCDSTRVKSNYIPHILYIVVCEARQTCGI